MSDPTTAFENPLGLNGFKFCRFTLPDADTLARQFFEALGFIASHCHPTKDVTRYQKGRITLLLNREPTPRAADFRAAHGPSASGMTFRLADPASASDQALAERARPITAGLACH